MRLPKLLLTRLLPLPTLPLPLRMPLLLPPTLPPLMRTLQLLTLLPARPMPLAGTPKTVPKD